MLNLNNYSINPDNSSLKSDDYTVKTLWFPVNLNCTVFRTSGTEKQKNI